MKGNCTSYFFLAHLSVIEEIYLFFRAARSACTFADLEGALTYSDSVWRETYGTGVDGSSGWLTLVDSLTTHSSTLIVKGIG
jgi:hypothetical protein